MSWALFSFKFTEAGEYKVRFIDDAYKTLAAEYVTIKMNDGETVKASSESETDYKYYEGTIIKFCVDVSAAGEPIQPSDVFNIGSSGGFVNVLINVGKELKTEQFVVDVYTGDNYDKFVETLKYDVNASRSWTFFKYTFRSAGKYKMSVYNKAWTHIQTGFVTVNMK